jgi:hypothetical protein
VSQLSTKYGSLNISQFYGSTWPVTLVALPNIDIDSALVKTIQSHESPIPQVWFLLQKMIVAELLKIFPAFYGTHRFFKMFTRACYWPQS